MKQEDAVVPESTPEAELFTPCGAWAFILGASLNAFCRLAAEHEGDHQTEINVLAAPKSRFTITWTLESEADAPVKNQPVTIE